MKKINVLLLLFCFGRFVHAQNSEADVSWRKTDSLRSLITNTKEDSTKIILLDELAKAYRDEKKIDSSILTYKKSLELNEKTGFSRLRQCWEMSALNYLLYETGNYSESLQFASKNIELVEQLNDTFQLGIVHLAFGHNYKALGEYRQALKHYFTAREFFKLHWEARIGHEENRFTFLCISEVYLKMNKPDSALVFAQQAYKLAKDDSIYRPGYRGNSIEKNYLIYSLRILGDIYLMKGLDEEALIYYRQYVPGFITYKENNRDLGFVYNNMARIFRKRNLPDSAVFYAKNALANARLYSDQENLFNAATLLSEYYDGIDVPTAFRYLKIATVAKDGMISSDKLKHAQLLLYNEQIREKEQAIAAAKEAARKRMIIIISGILASIASLLIWYRIRQLRLKYKVKLEQKEAEKLKGDYEKKLLELEAKALRAQMNPHFIFNCMNSIKSLIQQDDKDKATAYLTTFSKLIRTIFQNSDKREITLFDEIETCRLYTQLEGMRFRDKLSYSFEVDEKIDLKSIMVPALILQPFIENSIWHGIMPKEHGGTIHITVSEKEEKIFCVVEDNGIGRELSMQNKFKGTSPIHQSRGVRLTQSRLELNNMLNQRNATVEIIDKTNGEGEPAGTKVTLIFTEE